MRKTVIGVAPLYDAKKESYWMLPGYLHGLEAAGAVPVILPCSRDEAVLDTVLELCDGFLFAGGPDLDPALYGAAPSEHLGPTCPKRDETEPVLFRRVLAADKPMLGICRGLQLFNALLGGTLYQDLPTEYPSDLRHTMDKPYDRPIHRVDLTPGSPIADLLGQTSIGVNSRHHQAIRDLAPPLREMGRSEDGLIEAVWLPEKTFVWAVQWHPESSYESDPNSLALFRALVEAAQVTSDRGQVRIEK